MSIHVSTHMSSWCLVAQLPRTLPQATFLLRGRMARPAPARPSSRTSARAMQKLKSHGVMLSVQDGVIEYDCGLIGSKMDCSLESVQDQNLMVMNKRYSGVVLWFCFFGVVYFATSDRGPTRICCRSEFLRICILHF